MMRHGPKSRHGFSWFGTPWPNVQSPSTRSIVRMTPVSAALVRPTLGDLFPPDWGHEVEMPNVPARELPICSRMANFTKVYPLI